MISPPTSFFQTRILFAPSSPKLIHDEAARLEAPCRLAKSATLTFLPVLIPLGDPTFSLFLPPTLRIGHSFEDLFFFLKSYLTFVMDLIPAICFPRSFLPSDLFPGGVLKRRTRYPPFFLFRPGNGFFPLLHPTQRALKPL